MEHQCELYIPRSDDKSLVVVGVACADNPPISLKIVSFICTEIN